MFQQSVDGQLRKPYASSTLPGFGFRLTRACGSWRLAEAGAGRSVGLCRGPHRPQSSPSTSPSRSPRQIPTEKRASRRCPAMARRKGRPSSGVRNRGLNGFFVRGASTKAAAFRTMRPSPSATLSAHRRVSRMCFTVVAEKPASSLALRNARTCWGLSRPKGSRPRTGTRWSSTRSLLVRSPTHFDRNCRQRAELQIKESILRRLKEQAAAAKAKDQERYTQEAAAFGGGIGNHQHGLANPIHRK